MYRWVEHTAEVELEIDAATEEEVFGEALSAFAELLGVPEPDARTERTVDLESPDRPSLLAEWIEELVFLAETQGFVPSAIRSMELMPDGLRAVVAGGIGAPPHVVKAVTYHRLGFESEGNKHTARVILDV